MKVNNKNKYNQLTSEERDKIAILRAQGKSLPLIASMIDRNKSTISRELRRNRTPVYNVYLPHKAHQRAITKKQSAGKRLRLNSLGIVLLLRSIILAIRVRDFPCALRIAILSLSSLVS